MLRFLESMQWVLFIFFTAAYAYQIFYLLVGLWGKQRGGVENAELHRYAAIISARNESAVIGRLIRTLKEQDYPSELLDVIVVADNCTDNTAEVARSAGAIVYERFNKVQVGKGYALDYLFKHIFEEQGEDAYDAFFVFDADNIVDPQFVREMNKMYDTGEYSALTSYRNSQNFCANWISAGYALWFLRESRFLNRPRTRLGVNCAVSGTGFLISADVLREEGGWNYHLLTEDIEFSIASAVRGRKIGYCGNAIIYDEQPEHFRQSWDQRLRWSKGFYQVDAKYTGALLRGCTRGGKAGMSCYDMLTDGCTVQPCYHRLAAAGRTPVRDQLRTAGIHYIPRYAHARPYSDADRARHYVQPVCLRRGDDDRRVEAHRGLRRGKRCCIPLPSRSSCSPMFRFRLPLWSARSSGSRSSMASPRCRRSARAHNAARGWGKEEGKPTVSLPL